jgi:hypothetical protein
VSSGKVESQYFVGAASPFGHSMSSHSNNVKQTTPNNGLGSLILAYRGNKFMPACLSILFNDGRENEQGRVISICALLYAANIAAWAWALVAFHDFPVLLGTATLAYSFGLRHDAA